MRRNPDYWLEDDAGNSLPYLDEIVHVIVPDLEAELAMFLAGESDTHESWARSTHNSSLCRKKETSRYTGRGPTFGTTFLVFNMNPGKNPDTGEPYVRA